MSMPTFHHKHYHSAHKRLLHDAISHFFDINFPKFFGPDIRNRIAEQLLQLIESQCPDITKIKPGQCVWNAIAIDTRADSEKLRLVPVILTLIDDSDIQRLANGAKLNTVRRDAMARVLDEAYQQGGLLSMRDISLLTWHHISNMTSVRQAWEKEHDMLLPHPGNLHDMGSCITHKTIIVVKAFYEKKDPRQVSRETHHTQKAVDKYLTDFHRVRTCYKQNPDCGFICQVTGMSSYLVKQYIEIIEKYEETGNFA